jgi:hypothetical protein
VIEEVEFFLSVEDRSGKRCGYEGLHQAWSLADSAGTELYSPKASPHFAFNRQSEFRYGSMD